MPRMRWVNAVVAALLAGSIVFGALQLLGPFLARHFDFFAEPRQPEKKIAASIAITSSKTTEWEKEEPLPDGAVIAKGPGPKVRQARAWSVRTTLIDITYETPIDVNSTADIAATVRQEQTDHRRSPELAASAHQGANGASSLSFSDDSASEPYAIQKLDWTIVLRLDGTDLAWLVNDIRIDQRAGLPVTKHWTARAKTAGEYKLRFPLQDINRAAGTKGFSVADVIKASINGVDKPSGKDNDLTLPLSVREHFMTARWFTSLAAFLGFMAALVTVMEKTFGSGWASKLLKGMGKRGRRAA